MSLRDSRALSATRVAILGLMVGIGITPPVANAVAGVVLLAFLLVPDLRDRLRRIAASRLALGALVFTLTLAIATAIGAVGPQGPVSALLHFATWRTLLLMLIAYAVFDTDRAKRQFMTAFIAFACLAAVVALITLAVDRGIKDFPPGIVLRNTVTQAMYFGVGAFFALILLVTQRAAPAWQRVSWVVAALLLLGMLLFLQTGRSGQVMFAILVLVAALRVLRGPPRVAAVLAVPLLAGAAFALSPVMQARFALAWQEVGNAATATEYTSMGIRVVMWQNSLELAKARPLLGYGMGGLEPAYAERIKQSGATGWKATVTGDPHNQFLSLWVDAGLLGLFGFLVFLACAAFEPAPDPWRGVALALLLGWCATSMVSSHFQTFNEGNLIALFLGVFLGPVAAGSDDRYRRL